MTLREYLPEDIEQILKLFYNTVHMVNAADYSPAQLDAWAPQNQDAAQWNSSLCINSHACSRGENGEIAGFADLAADGYFNRLYVRVDFKRRGIAL